MTQNDRDAEKRTEESKNQDQCDYDWCDGPAGDILPCFSCFDRTRSYDVDRDGGSAS